MNQKEEFSIKTEDDFDNLMEEVDNKLKDENYQIFQRPFNAWFQISSRFGLNLSFPPSNEAPSENNYNGDNLTLRIFEWYKDKYGEKTKVDLTWKMALLIRNDPYKVRLPLGFGAFVATCSIENFGNVKSPLINSQGELPEINILNLVDGLTKNYVKKLNREELKSIFNSFTLGNDARNWIETLLDNLLIQQAKGDIDASVNHIFTNTPQYGLSKWASLQATEKMIKAYIEEKIGKYPFGHNLKILAEKAKQAGLREIPEALLDIIQCPAGIRYGNPAVSLVEAVQAHHACIAICLGVSKQIFFSRQEGKVQLFPNKYYVNGIGQYTRCIRVDGDKATMMLFTEANGGNLEIQYVIDKTVWGEYVRLDIFAITQHLEERYQTIIRNDAKKRDDTIRKIVPYINK